MTRTLTANLVAFALFQAFAFGFFRDVTLAGDASFLANWDGSALAYAWMTKTITAYQQVELPLWDFSTFAGTSFLGELSTAGFYPVTAAASLVATPGDWRWIDAWIVFHFGLGLWFTFVFARAQGLAWQAALLGAGVFTLVGSTAFRASSQPYIFAGLVWLPLVLYCVHRALHARTRLLSDPFVSTGGIALGLTLLAGHVQPFVHAAFAAALYAATQCVGAGRGSWKRAVAVLTLVGGIAVAFSAVQWVPTLRYLDLSYRWIGDTSIDGLETPPFEHWAFESELRPSDFATLATGEIARDSGSLYVTFVALAFGCVGLFARGPLRGFASLLAVLSVAIALGGHTPLGALAYHVPGFSIVRQPIRMLYLYDFGMAMLAALGLDFTLRWLTRRTGRRIAAAGLSFAALGLFLVEAERQTQRTLPRVALEERHPAHYYARTPLIDLMLARQAESGHLYRTAWTPKDVLPPNLGNVWPVFTTVGHRATMQRNYFDHVASDWDLRAPLWDRLAVRDVVTTRRYTGWRELAREGDLALYERPDALPLFWFAPDEATGSGETPARVLSSRFSTNAVEIELEPGESGMLVFAQPRYPGWRVRVEGEERALENFDVFGAVSLREGDTHVAFSYWERDFTLLLGLSLASACAWLVTVGMALRRATRREPHGRSAGG